MTKPIKDRLFYTLERPIQSSIYLKINADTRWGMNDEIWAEVLRGTAPLSIGIEFIREMVEGLNDPKNK